MEYNPMGQGPAGGITAVVAEAVTLWGANIIRLPLSQDFWFGCTNSKVGGGSVDGAAYQSAVSTIVSLCSSNSAYVLLDLHWSGTQTGATAPCGTGWGNAVNQQYMPDDNSVTFWSSVATLFANNPAVLFDLYNEPYDYDGNGWSIWQNGGKGSSYSFHTPGMQTLLNTVRATGANNMVVMGGLDYAYDLSQVNSYPMTNAGNGIMYSSHIYPFKGSNPWTPADGNNKIAPAAFGHPVLIGEFGQNATIPPGSTSDPTGTWDQTLLGWMDGGNTASYSFNGTAWDMHWNSCPCLLQSDWTTATGYHGVPVKNWLSTPIPPCATPTPTPTLTPCGYPGPLCTATDTPTPTDTPTATPTPNPYNDILWPNPWDETTPLSFYHTLTDPADSVHVRLYTVAFRKVFDEGDFNAGAGQWTYNLDGDKVGKLSNGFYYLVVDEVRGSHTRSKVLKLLIRR